MYNNDFILIHVLFNKFKCMQITHNTLCLMYYLISLIKTVQEAHR